MTSKTTDSSSPINHNQLSSFKEDIMVISDEANDKHKLELVNAAFKNTSSLKKVAKVNLVDVFNQGVVSSCGLAAVCKTPISQMVAVSQIVDTEKPTVDIASETASLAASVDQAEATNQIPEASCGMASSPRMSKSREAQFIQVAEAGMAATGGSLSETASQAEASKPFIATNKIEMASCKGINNDANSRALVSPKIHNSEAVDDVIQIAETEQIVKIDRITETASRAIVTTLKLLKLLGQD